MKVNMIELHCLLGITDSRDLFQIDFADWRNGFVGTPGGYAASGSNAVSIRQNHFRASRVGSGTWGW
jgi:hypothetical protein